FLQQQGDNDLANRSKQQRAVQNESRNGVVSNTMTYNFDEAIPWAELSGKGVGLVSGQPSAVKIGILQPMWLRTEGQPERLVLARLAQSGGRKQVQGVLLDWP